MESTRLVADVASEGQASDIVVLDIGEACDFADYFVILTAGSARQMRAVAEEIDQSMKKATVGLLHREGTPQSGWMLLDFGDVIVHLFAPEQRDFYRLEDVWSHAREVVRIL